MFGKMFKKVGRSLGKGIHTIEKGNTFLGKSIHNAEKIYSTGKQALIKVTPAPLRPELRTAIYAFEKNPLAQAVVSGKEGVKLASSNLRDLTSSARMLQSFMG